jgi:glycosyltransferase involved in cell wall biosynthesis
MQSLSIVIVCKNEAGVIEKTLQSFNGLTDDIIVYDNGSTDATIEIAKQFNVQLYHGNWEGFGKTKRKANALAKYNWILSLDADEAIDDPLKQSLLQLTLADVKTVYDISFKNFLGDAYLKYGEWGGDHHIRLFNRTQVNWNDASVHEELVLPEGATIKKLPGYVLHKTVKSIADYQLKMESYAMLNAQKYFRQGKKASWLKCRLAPAFSFFKYYILKLGFLDGYAGYICAKMTACYTFLKYEKLRELRSEAGSNKSEV